MSTSLKQAIEAAKVRVSAAYDAVEAKGGTKPSVANLAALPSAIESIPSGGGGGYTGHIDEVGLRAIGWRDEDIEWLRGEIDWMEEDDLSYKVPQKLIDLYAENGGWSGELVTAHKAQPYYTFAPYFQTSGDPSATNGYRHNGATFMIAMPIFNFMKSYSVNMYNMFIGCNSLKYVPFLLNSGYINLTSNLPIRKFIQADETTSGNSSQCSFNGYLIEKIHMIGTNSSAPNAPYLRELHIYRAYGTHNFRNSPSITKESILFCINNSRGNTATIQLESTLLARMQSDADIQAALNNYPNITLSA